MRLIDASRAIGRVEEIPVLADKNQAFYEGCRYMQKRVLRIFHTSKTIDAVPVVRCKDCKHHRPRTGFTFIEDGKHHRYCSCGKWGRCVLDDDFCSYGERKDGETNG